MSENKDTEQELLDELEDSLLYFKGLPTDMDIRKLREKYPITELTRGKVITYAEIEKLLELEWNSNRFKTVTNRWRRLIEKESGLYLDPNIPGVSFKVLTHQEQVVKMRKKQKTGNRCYRNVVKIGKNTSPDELSEEDKKELRFNMMKAAKMTAISQLRSPALLPEM